MGYSISWYTPNFGSVDGEKCWSSIEFGDARFSGAQVEAVVLASATTASLPALVMQKMSIKLWTMQIRSRNSKNDKNDIQIIYKLYNDHSYSF